MPVPDRNWKLGSYLDYWLNEVVKPSRRVGTYQKDDPIVRLHLKPGLGRLSLAALTVPLLQTFFNEQRADGKSLATVHEMRKVLSAALTRALKEELVSRNVARLVELPPYVTRKVKPWTMDEVGAFLNAARSDPLYPAFVLSALYGLRRGEVLGLRWADVDFKRDVLEIRQQLQRRADGLATGPLKTFASERDLRLRPMARTVLLQRRGAQLAARAQSALPWPVVDEAEALIFTTATGHPIEPRNYVRSFQRICTQHGIRRIRVHDMRHTLATLASELQASPKDVQFTLGHSQVSTTIGVYQHGSIDSSDRIVGAVEKLLVGRVSGAGGAAVCRQMSTGSRQIVPSAGINLLRDEAATPGAVFGVRTRDPFLTIFPEETVAERLTEVKAHLRVQQRHWVLGIVAVNSCRQSAMRRLPAIRRKPAVVARALHARHGLNQSARTPVGHESNSS